MWAFSTVSARSLVFNNTNTTELDDNGVSMIVPLLDFVNHSHEPNCIVMPHHDKLTDSSYVMLNSLRTIEKGE